MATKYEENDYLDFYNLDDQIQMFDLIVVHELPPEDEIELYDIVVYEINNMLIIHRIVGIEEPDESHPDERYFLLQGDSNEVPDRFPVLYSQMRGIYRGERMPFVGSFITFLQSPAGWLCFLLILFATIATPIVERILEREMEKRWRLLQKKEVLQKYSAILDQTKMAAEEKKASRLELAKLYFLRLDLHSSKHPQRDRQYTFKFADTNFFFNKKKK
jgi:signal peptidase I